MTITLGRGHRGVVVGAGGSIGAAICAAYADASAEVVALDVDLDAARETVAALAGRSHRALHLDVGDRQQVQRVAHELASVAPVNSVAYAAGLAPTHDILDFDWSAYHQTLEVNLHGALHTAQAFGTVMRDAARGGSFAFLSSVAGKRGEAGAGAYCASKFALQGVVECFAAEVARFGIRVNAVCPGNVDTAMLRRVAEADARRSGRDPDSVLHDYASASPAGRLVTVTEVANVILWLASEGASGITGESINVDMGLLTG